MQDLNKYLAYILTHCLCTELEHWLSLQTYAIPATNQPSYLKQGSTIYSYLSGTITEHQRQIMGPFYSMQETVTNTLIEIKKRI